MSHMTTCVTEMRELKYLLEALEKVGFTRDQILVSDQLQVLYGYDGLARPEPAEVRIPRQFVGRLSNDLGFRKAADGRYVAVISDYDRQDRYDRDWLDRLHQQYAIATTLPQLIRQGWKHLTAEIQANGDIIYEGQRR